MKFSLPIIFFLFLSLPTLAQVSWSEVQAKLKSKSPYSVTYKYQGPNGVYDFDYRFGGDKLRTEILSSKSDPSKRGTVIVYDKSWNADRIRAKTGGGLVVRNLTHKDVVGRPFHQSLFGMIYDQTKSLGTPVATKKANQTVFAFGKGVNAYTVVVDERGDLVRTERTVDRINETRDFTKLTWAMPSKLSF